MSGSAKRRAEFGKEATVMGVQALFLPPESSPGGPHTAFGEVLR